jgi:hypothetical protein
VLALLFDSVGSPVETLFVHSKAVRCFLKRVGLGLHFPLTLVKFSLLLGELTLLGRQAAGLVLNELEFEPEFFLCGVHLGSESFSCDGDLLHFDLKFLLLVYRILLVGHSCSLYAVYIG